MGSKKKIQAKPARGTIEAKKHRKPTAKSTSKKHADDAELFKAVVEHSHDGILFTNADLGITYASPSITQISGYEPADLIGKYGADFIHQDDREATTEKIGELLQNPGMAASLEARLRHKNGSWFWVDITAANLLNNPRIQAIVINMRDITEHKQAEQEYRAIFENAPVGIFQSTPEGRYLKVNSAMAKIYGYASPDEMVATVHNIGEQIYIDHASRQAFQQSLAAHGQVIGAENKNRRKDGSIIWTSTNARIVRDSAGRILYYEGFIRDITERKQSEQALRKSDTLYRQAIEVAGAVPYLQSYPSEEFHINYEFIGEGIRSLTGYGADEFTEAIWDTLVQESHLLGELAKYPWREAVQRVRTGASPIWQCEHRIQTRHGETRWILEGAVELRDEQGVSHGSIGMFQDITERKQAEQTLQKSEALYRKAIEVAGAVPYYESYYDHDKKIKYDFIGEGIRQITGYGPEEFTATLWDSLTLDIHLVDELEGYSLDDAIERVRGGQNPIWKCEHRIRHRNGEIRWVFEAAVELRDEHGASHGSIGMYQDITERKLAEAALRENEERLSLFFNQSLDGFFFSMLDEPIEWDTSTDKDKLLDYVLTHQHITEANDAMLEQYGATRDKFMGRTASDFFAHDLAQARRFRRDLFDHGHMHIDTEERKDDGTPIWIEGDYVCMRDAQGRIIGMFGIQRDATLRKKAEEELRDSETRYRNLVERLTQVIYTTEIGVNGIWSYVSPQIEKLLGFTPQEWMANPGIWSEQIHPDDRDKQIALEQQANVRGEPFEGEYRIKTRAGKWIWVRDSGQVLPPQGNGDSLVHGILVDITEHKLVEEALSLSKAQLLANLENTPSVAIQWYDAEGRIQYWNPASEALYGWRSDEALGKTLDQLIHTPEEQAEFMRILAEIRATGKPYGPYEVQVHTRGGGTSWVLATTFSLPMNENNYGFVCMDVNILERKQAEEQLQKQLHRLNALHTVDMAINSSANIQITLEVLLNQALSQLNADAADVLLFNQTTQTLELAADRGLRSTAALPKYQRLGDFFAGQVINQRRTIHIPNMMGAGKQLNRTPMLASEEFTDYIGIPLIAKGQIKGVLEIYQRAPLQVNGDWLNFLEVLGGQAAIAIDNSQLVQGLQRSNMEIIVAYDATIEGWSRAMDLRDKETEGHTQRVTTMTLKLARAMGIREADILHIQRGGLLHDIGKLGVPDGILLKAGALTKEEWEIMRQHPTFAFNMLAPITYLKNAIDIPYCHHEKWDGTGYPRGLKGEEIPLAARIFAIADVWDALTSDRPYRLAWSREKVLEYIQEQSGKQFDPLVVEAFMKMIVTEL